MKKTATLILYRWLPCLVLAFSSCSVPHYMYAPTAFNVPGFTEKHESALDATFSTHGTDLMAGYAITDQLAILGSWFFRHEDQYHDSTGRLPDSLRYLRELFGGGLSYTLPLSDNRHFFLSFSGGFGAGRFRMAERNMRHPDSLNPAGFTLYHTSLKRYYLQPAFIIKYKVVQVVTSARVSTVRYGFRPGTDLKPFGVHNHRSYPFLEGAMTVRLSPPATPWLRFQLQVGFSVPTQTTNFDYHGVIGNAGIGIDPVKLFRGKRSGAPAPDPEAGTSVK